MLTASDAVVMLSQPILFPTPQQLQGFAADDVTDMDAAEILEALMGVDGVLSFGFVWTARMQTITLQGDSASNSFFDQVNNQQQAAQTVYPLNGIVTLPAIGLKFTLVNGGLQTYKPMPAVKRIIQPRSYRITWGRVIPAPA